MNFGDKIRQRRRAIFPEVWMKDVAKKANITWSALQKIETGATQNPGIKTVEAINNALDDFEAPQRATQRGAAQHSAAPHSETGDA